MSGCDPRITFGMIVLNGMPFLPFNLRTIYPFAHQIIVVEGASPGAAGIAREDGHSSDGTLHELQRFGREEDPERKLVVITAEDEHHDDGFWPGEKDEQSKAYAKRATGDYLWQIDVDEFYAPDAMRIIADRLADDPGITAITFPTLTVWGDLGCIVDGWHLRRGAGFYDRLFRWGPGYVYETHRPPTVLDADGRDTRTVRWLDGQATARLGVVMYHYSLLFPKQVREKTEYYASWGLYGDWYADARRWLADSYLTLRRPYRVHNEYRYPSWLQRFSGPHPPEVYRMMEAVSAERIPVELRSMADASVLLDSPRYAAGRALLKWADPLDVRLASLRHRLAATARTAFDVAKLRGGHK